MPLWESAIILLVLLLGAAIAVAAREAYYFLWLPALASVAAGHNRAKIAERVYRRVLDTRSVGGDRWKVFSRYRLAWLLMEARQFEDARDLLTQALLGRPNPATEAQIRMRIADCLDWLGKKEQAADERARAQALLASGGGAAALIAQARLVERERRHAEAIELYERALSGLGRGDRQQRIEVLVSLAMVRYNAGHPQLAATAAEEALKLQPMYPFSYLAHTAASLGYSGLGKLSEAEGHRRRMFELARERGDVERGAKALVGLANVRMQLGKLQEAVQACEQAAGMSLAARRNALLAQADCLRHRGRYEAALQLLEQASRAQGIPRVTGEGFSQAMLQLATAWVNLEWGRQDDALAALQRARDEVEADPKLRVWVLATECLVRARKGDADASRKLMSTADEWIASADLEPQTLLPAREMLARACHELGLHAEAEQRLRDSLALGPVPLHRASQLFHLGESRSALGDGAGARTAWEEAVALSVDSRYARLAAERLSQLPFPNASSALPTE